MSEIKSPEEFEWYSKLASKLRRIEKGEFTVKEYLQQVYQKMGRCYLVQVDPIDLGVKELKDLTPKEPTIKFKGIVEPSPANFDFASTEHLEKIQNMIKLDGSELHERAKLMGTDKIHIEDPTHRLRMNQIIAGINNK